MSAAQNRGRRPLSERLAARLVRAEGGCLEWQGWRGTYGHGQIMAEDGRVIGTHVAAWTLENGPVPEGHVIRHSCDNPPCCNPDHLLSGTPAENVQDAVERGRVARGAQLPHYKLTDEQVAEIRRRHDPEAYPSRRRGNQRRSNTPELAAEFGIAESYLRQLVRREERKDVA